MHNFFAATSLAICLIASPAASANSKLIVLPLQDADQAVVTPATLGILVNVNDPQSVALGREYANIRGVPPGNIIELQLPRVKYIARSLMVRELDRLKNFPGYDRLTAFALAFDRPYRVEANQSITSAISQGITLMKWQGNCNLTLPNPDANAAAGAILRQKPSMMLMDGSGLPGGVALAERGKQADASDPPGDIVLVKTQDAARSAPREASMDRANERYGHEITIKDIRTQNYSGYSNLVGFQIGLAVLSQLDTLRFLPGAYADHLTSYGGSLEDNRSQTVISDIVKAGATASFGTVREPCNFPAKFPDPERMLENYLRGDSILEAYWKSVGMMTEGLLVGEPLARPFPIFDAELADNVLSIRANRHSAAYLDAVRISPQEADTGKQQPQTYSFSLYAVQSGKPHLLQALTTSRNMTVGDLIGQFTISPEDQVGLMIGVLPAR